MHIDCFQNAVGDKADFGIYDAMQADTACRQGKLSVGGMVDHMAHFLSCGVKSGMETGALPFLMDCSDSGVMHMSAAAS